MAKSSTNLNTGLLRTVRSLSNVMRADKTLQWLIFSTPDSVGTVPLTQLVSNDKWWSEIPASRTKTFRFDCEKVSPAD